ncbi:hypothetical protein ABRP91_06920 [Pectobacterium brasiliense]|uniref:hypothetical protein n=1 Tax=Pectobacterium brasiliense TaxID=180957 RepID=UPI0032EE7FC9
MKKPLLHRNRLCVLQFLGAASLLLAGWSSQAAETLSCTGTYDLPQCVADVESSGGGTVVLDGKTYLLTASLILKNNVNITGQGSSTVITWDDSVKETIDAPLLYSTTVDDITIKNLKILGTIDQASTSNDLRNDHIGLYLNCGGDPTAGETTECNNIHLESVEVANSSHGIHIKGASDVTAVDLNLHNNGNTEVDYFHNIYFRRVANLIVKQTSASSVGFYDSPRGHGIRGSHLINVYFANLSVYNNADHGIHTDNIYNARFHDLNVQNNCAAPTNTCAEIACYGDFCEINYNAPEE